MQVIYQRKAPGESGKGIGKQDREGKEASKGTMSGQGPGTQLQS